VWWLERPCPVSRRDLRVGVWLCLHYMPPHRGRLLLWSCLWSVPGVCAHGPVGAECDRGQRPDSRGSSPSGPSPSPICQDRGDHPHPHPRFGMGDHRLRDSHRGFRALSTALSRSLSSASCQWPSGARAEALPGSPSRPLPALCPRGCGFQLTASSRYMCFSVK
jgi:hypothetical protein